MGVLGDLEVMLHGQLLVVVWLQLLSQVLIIGVLLGADEEPSRQVLIIKWEEVVEDIFGLLLVPPLLLKVLLIREGVPEC